MKGCSMKQESFTLSDLLIPLQQPPIEITYIIEGDPIALARHRHRNDKTWDPQKQLKLFWGIELKRQHNDRPFYTGPLSLEVNFFFDFPEKMTEKKKDLLTGTPHTKRPDLDNCIKFICDIANSILYQDDCSIACIKAQKLYDPIARTEFTIREIHGTKKSN